MEKIQELDEFHIHTYEILVLYKEKIKRWHDAKVLNSEFHMGDEALIFNSRLKIFIKKLKSKRSGPFMVVNMYPSGTIELVDHEKRMFTVNGQRLKNFYISGASVSKVEVLFQKNYLMINNIVPQQLRSFFGGNSSFNFCSLNKVCCMV